MKPLMKHALALSVAALAVSAATQGADAPAWVQESNRDAMILLKVQAKYAPEFAGRTGVEGLDDKIFDLKKGVYERSRKDSEAALAELKAKQKTATDPNVKQDLDILISATERNRKLSDPAEESQAERVSGVGPRGGRRRSVY